jgi:hypothetical protein
MSPVDFVAGITLAVLSAAAFPIIIAMVVLIGHWRE